MRSENFSAWIEVNGQCLPEFQAEETKENGIKYVTCWIPSEAGKSFQVCVHDTDREIDVGFGIGIDGKDLPGRVLFRLKKDAKEKPDNPSATVRGFQPSRRKFQPFAFSKCILIADDDEVLLDPASRVGQIEVDLTEVKFRKTKKRKRATPLSTPARRVHERLQKGIVHCVELGDAVKLEEECEEADLDVVDCISSSRDLVTFVFKYRPIDVLRAERIAPPLIHTEVIRLDEESDEEIVKEEEIDPELASLKSLEGALEKKLEALKQNERRRTLRPLPTRVKPELQE